MGESGSNIGVAVVGCYTLHLYCSLDNPAHQWHDFPQEFTDEFGSKCRQAARQLGWKLSRDGKRAICPKCNPTNKESTQ